MIITAINVRNQFRGKVKDLGLVVGQEVIALVKSTEVSIAAL